MHRIEWKMQARRQKKVEKKMKNANKRPAVKHDGVDSIDGE